MRPGTRRTPHAARLARRCVCLLWLAAGCSREAGSAPGAPGEGARADAAAAVERAVHAFRPLPTRMLVFGVDGATWDVLQPLVETGRMPHLAGLCRDGLAARLATMKPNLSPILWTTIATGVDPDAHGIHGFTVPIPGSDRVTLPSSNLRRVPAVWNILSAFGQTVGVANWWVTFPAEPVDGFVISDRASLVRKTTYRSLFDFPEEDLDAPPREVYPPELFLELAPLLRPSVEIDPALVRRVVDLPPALFDELQAQPSFSRASPLSVLKFALLQDESMAEAGLQALAAYRPEVMLFYSSGLDAVEHHFWKYHEPDRFPALAIPPEEIALYGDVIPRYAMYVDDLLGRFLAAYAGEEVTVVVVSDHGHAAYPDYGTERAHGYGKIASGWHAFGPPGVLVLSGPGVSPAGRLEHPGLLDVAPTLLALRGIPVGDDMQGRVLVEALDPAFLAAHPVARVPTYRNAAQAGDAVPVSSEADPERLEKLRALGYIDADSE
jgi:Type I phosphodiesterase / nucleotide pyrophosphatase